jgi:hypothetical protein
MRKLVLVAVACLFFSTSLEASPILLICSGDLNYPGNRTDPIASETAILDIGEGTFKPPLYSAYSLLKVKDAEVTFGYETTDTSIWGSLDRVSGSLSMTVMRPAEREKLLAGGSAHILAVMTAKCAPAKRMF